MSKRPKHVALTLVEFERLESYLTESIPVLSMYTPTANEGYEQPTKDTRTSWSDPSSSI